MFCRFILFPINLNWSLLYIFTFLYVSFSLFFFVMSLLLLPLLPWYCVMRTEAWILERQRNCDVSSCNIRITQFFKTHFFRFELDSLVKLFVAMNVMLLFWLTFLFILINPIHVNFIQSIYDVIQLLCTFCSLLIVSQVNLIR